MATTAGLATLGGGYLALGAAGAGPAWGAGDATIVAPKSEERFRCRRCRRVHEQGRRAVAGGPPRRGRATADPA